MKIQHDLNDVLRVTDVRVVQCGTATIKVTLSGDYTLTIVIHLFNVRTINYKLECGPMPNVMAALPNIGRALYSTPQSLADIHH